MINLIGIVGSGQMGGGIAHVCALNNYNVLLYDVSNEQLNLCIETIIKNLSRQAKKGLIAHEDIATIIERITCLDSLNGLKDADIVIEAATENEEIKISIFKELDNIVKDSAILASNTSSISITKVASNTKRPGKVIGMHFMNPVPVMKLVEIIKGIATDDSTFDAVITLAEKLGKDIAVSKDYPGFIVNRILMPMINEAVFTYYEGIANVEDIDKAMKLGTNQPMGPLALADLIGLDTVLNIINVLYEEFKDPKFRPCPLLTKMVEAGYLGRKVGKGFYEYN